MSGAQSAGEALRAALDEPMRTLAGAVYQARHARAEMQGVDDLVALMGSVAGVVLAMEALQDAAKRAEAAGRAALAEAMSLGATTVQTASHTVSLRNAPRSVRVLDESVIPPSLFYQPPPKPDLTAIRKLLNDGKRVPGCELSNGGAQHVQIRNRERASA